MTGPVADVFTYWGTVMGGVTPIYTMMSSDPHPWCTSSWDCNNRDKQDWKREGDWYYATYNGANYYRCNGEWGVSLARSPLNTTSGPLVGGTYSRVPLARGIPAVVDNTCGISYPVVNVIGGELFIYYAFVTTDGNRIPLRAKLEPV